MRALDPRLLRYARATRTFLIASVSLGVLSALLIVAQAWLLADVVSRAFIGGQLAGAARRTARASCSRVVLARARVAWAGELTASRSSARAKSQLRAALLARIGELGLGRPRGAAHRRARDPRDARDRRARRLLLAVSAAAVARRDRAQRRDRRGALARLDLGGDHRVHDPADPAVHGARRRRDAGADGPPVPHPGAARRPLPRRRRRAADAEGLRAGQGAGGVDPRDHRALPRRSRCRRCASPSSPR